MAAAFSESHSTKAIEDGIVWGHGTTMEILLAASRPPRGRLKSSPKVSWPAAVRERQPRAAALHRTSAIVL